MFSEKNGGMNDHDNAIEKFCLIAVYARRVNIFKLPLRLYKTSDYHLTAIHELRGVAGFSYL